MAKRGRGRALCTLWEGGRTFGTAGLLLLELLPLRLLLRLLLLLLPVVGTLVGPPGLGWLAAVGTRVLLASVLRAVSGRTTLGRLVVDGRRRRSRLRG